MYTPLPTSCPVTVTHTPFVYGSFDPTKTTTDNPNQHFVWSANFLCKTSDSHKGTYSRTQDFASLAYATSKVYYDYDNKLVAVKERRLNKTASFTTDTWKIMQYSEAISYTIENGRCQRLPLADKMPSQCIPDQAVSLGTHKYPGFVAEVWFVKDNNTGRSTRYGVTIDSCMSVTESYITKGPEYTYVTSLYENMTQSIDDPSVFVPPSFCPRAAHRIRERLLEWRSLFPITVVHRMDRNN
ncbi:hypothetical protein CHS0354_036108 [Potamilus streckersoni]|uniref:Uncharacterized protein n=1 Tax=Potamilus streckersoni TaxID=2493646 RepID=A0AAE0T3Q6_9BIVA|nr:hypothetical protein CHS0354_036108 [Potamilus streckersoni]